MPITTPRAEENRAQEGAMLTALLSKRPMLSGVACDLSVKPLIAMPPQLLAEWGERNRKRMDFCPSYRSMSNLNFCRAYLESLLPMEDASVGGVRLYHGFALVLREFDGDRRILALCEVGDMRISRSSGYISYGADAEIEGTGVMGLFVKDCLRRVKASGVRRVTAEIAEGNDRSARLAHRLGFHHEGLMVDGEVLDHKPVDLHIWGMLL